MSNELAKQTESGPQLTKLCNFLHNPCVENLLTKEEYDLLDPYNMGFASYMQSSWDESQLDEDVNPFDQVKNPDEFNLFKKGAYAAMMYCQDICE